MKNKIFTIDTGEYSWRRFEEIKIGGAVNEGIVVSVSKAAGESIHTKVYPVRWSKWAVIKWFQRKYYRLIIRIIHPQLIENQ